MADPATPLSTPETREPDWELARQWAGVWRVIRWSLSAGAAILFLLVIGQGFLFYRVFADIHPALGAGFLVVLAAGLVWLVGRPLVSFFSLPVMARPPAISIDPAAPQPAAIAARAAYSAAYLRSLSRHPRFAGESRPMAKALARGRALAQDARRASTPAAAKAALEKLAAFEKAEIEARLAPIDAEAERIIRAEAVAVGVATAVSMNGTVDAFIVLWRSANLVARIARLYAGRPSLGLSIAILRDVAAVVVIARALEDVTDLTGDVIGSLLGRMGGLVAGPVMDGAINAMMTLKIGYLARRRCRSFEGWSPRDVKGISTQALQQVKQASGAVLNDLIQRCGGLAASASKAAEKAMAGSKSAWSLIQGWFGVRQGET